MPGGATTSAEAPELGAVRGEAELLELELLRS